MHAPEDYSDVCPFSSGGSGLSRRTLLSGMAVAGIGMVATGGGQAEAAPPPIKPIPVPGGLPAGLGADGRPLPGFVKWKHAVGDPRGSGIIAKLGRLREARFGTMFKSLPAFAPDDTLLAGLAAVMTEDRGTLDDIIPDYLDNPDMPSGYIYLGQFIDHDMTRDTTPLSLQNSDPHALTNFDTPSFDLGSVYGNGPAANPELYEADGKHLKLVTNAYGVRDLPRNAAGAAFVGDPRNDENLIISQMQQAFILLHNRFLDKEAKGNFAAAQQLTRWHFQWVIVHDFLPRVVGQPLLDSMIKTVAKRIFADLRFYRPGNLLKPMMPVEYSAAAYRWGHSGIRPEYEMHDSPGLSPNPAVLPIFNGDPDPVHSRDLRGSRPLYAEATVDWNYFFDIPGLASPDDRNMARMIDTQVARPLLSLPDSVVAHTPDAILALAERNLLRGKRLGLPCGQDVAAAMKATLPTMPAPLSNTDLGLVDAAWGGKAPLWYYILKEAELGGGRRLGAVGGRIVAEVILGLLQFDRLSYWNAAVPFTPVGGPNFTMGHLLALAGAPALPPVVEDGAAVLAPPPQFATSRGVVVGGVR